MKKSTFLALTLLSAPAFADGFKDETLLQTLPAGFQVGSQNEKNGVKSMEFTKTGETIDNWTQLFTTQVIVDAGKKPVTPVQFLNNVYSQWKEACPAAKSDAFLNGGKPGIATGEANGYNVAMVMLNCPKNSETGKPEVTLIRVIKGSDSMYVVQKAFKFHPKPKQVKEAVDYMYLVNVCDTREAKHPCPDLKAK